MANQGDLAVLSSKTCLSALVRDSKKILVFMGSPTNFGIHWGEKDPV